MQQSWAAATGGASTYMLLAACNYFSWLAQFAQLALSASAAAVAAMETETFFLLPSGYHMKCLSHTHTRTRESAKRERETKRDSARVLLVQPVIRGLCLEQMQSFCCAHELSGALPATKKKERKKWGKIKVYDMQMRYRYYKRVSILLHKIFSRFIRLHSWNFVHIELKAEWEVLRSL